MRRPSYYIGVALFGLSLLSVMQTARELALWMEQPHFAEHSRSERTLRFAGHEYTVTDDQPNAPHSYEEFEGIIQPRVDGRPLGAPSRARIRRGLGDLGRYFGWYQAWQFTEKATGDSSLWLARRLQPTGHDSPRFEITRVSGDGIRTVDVVRAWELASEFRRYRSAQFLVDGPWSVFPLTVGELLGFIPPLLLVFPIGSLMLGVHLMRRGSTERTSGVSGRQP